MIDSFAALTGRIAELQKQGNSVFERIYKGVGGVTLELLIFWNHVGREHGGLDYAEDIRRNPPEVIQKNLELKEQLCRKSNQINRFVRYDEATLIELPPAQSEKKYIIVYFIDKGLQFSLNFKTKYPWWLIDIVDVQEIKTNVFCIHDLFIDISVNTDGSYIVYDMDDFERAFSLAALTHDQISRGLRSLHTILTELNAKKFPNNILKDIVRKYM
jgi:hypothetical protein